ncbi:Accelerated cell death 11 [Cucurbita argyrosperma subsp. argyrosperma]|nr:Accelerated cell death 11 [Cucurbita argyrosperma subsp. argyrosperma]
MADLNVGEKPLRNISESFKALAATVNAETTAVEVAPFSRACSFISPLFGCLGIAFKFAEMDYVAKVFAPHHGWAIRKAVGAGMYALPSKAQLLRKLNEDEASARIFMQDYVAASAPVIQYVEKLFFSRDLGIDW